MVPVVVPSLEDRREDIPELAQYFIEMFNRSQGLPLREMSSEAEALLQTMSWPGNVRQLRNVIERVLILGDGAGPIEARELPGQEAPTRAGDRLVLGGAMATLPLREAREVFEREYLLTQINRFGGNISRTAGFVGMERSALHRKLKSLGVVSNGKTGAGQEDQASGAGRRMICADGISLENRGDRGHSAALSREKRPNASQRSGVVAPRAPKN